jgi:hypothetical protein
MVDFAVACLPNASAGKSPFFIERGYQPKMSFDWKDELASEEARDAQTFVQHLHEIWEQAQKQIAIAQERQRKYANRHHREIDFDVGDQMYITTKHMRLDRPSRKLSEQTVGPFPILRKIGNAFEVELPASMKIHPVFSPDKLRKASNSEPLPGQIPDAPPPTEILGELEEDVDEILDSRIYYRKLQYKARWTGAVDNNWYAATSFKNAPLKLMDYHARYPDKPGPSVRLADWVAAAANDLYLEDHVDDNKPIQRG